MSILRSLSSGVHSEQAPAEVEEAIGFVGEELGSDFEEAAARVDDDAGFAQDGELPAAADSSVGEHVTRRPVSFESGLDRYT